MRDLDRAERCRLFQATDSLLVTRWREMSLRYRGRYAISSRCGTPPGPLAAPLSGVRHQAAWHRRRIRARCAVAMRSRCGRILFSPRGERESEHAPAVLRKLSPHASAERRDRFLHDAE